MPIKFKIQGPGLAPVLCWTDRNSIEDGALQQLINVSRLPFVHPHIAVMPDVHKGEGATIGSVIPTVGAIIPSAVGVDIGCGMMAYRTDYRLEEIEPYLEQIHSTILSRVPVGRSNNGGPGDIGAWTERRIPRDIVAWWKEFSPSKILGGLLERHPSLITSNTNTLYHLGTLGTGNHFIEICADEEDRVWVVVHSGSRGVGARIGNYFMKLAQAKMKEWFIDLPDPALAYFPATSDEAVDYLMAVRWAQQFAKANRMFITWNVLNVLQDVVGPLTYTMEIDCHHNYVEKTHIGHRDVFLTRKGAIDASAGKWGIIPGSMGARSYIVRGKGSEASFNSCSHGAGRLMSRKEAERRHTQDDLISQMEGIVCDLDGVLDEIPSAYKNIDEVMANQEDLVEIVHTLRQVVNVKGKS